MDAKQSEFGNSPLENIKAKCEQYWNERGVSDEEFHVSLERIHEWAVKAEAIIATLVAERDAARDTNIDMGVRIAELEKQLAAFVAEYGPAGGG